MEKDTYIRVRLSSEQKALLEDRSSEAGLSMSEYIRNLIGGGVIAEEDVITTPKEEFVITEGFLKERGAKEVTLEDLQEEVEEAIEIGEKENWERVRELLSSAGYEWDARQRAILKNSRVVYRPKNR